ncbi:MAG: CvpA family protein [Oscillospiraceae bacterium]|nr:CvpA family protein [Oscillospiraceae bacterium]
MDPIKVDFSGKGGDKKPIVIPPERAGLKIVISVILSLITAVVAYYFMLPPMNLKAIEFYYFIGIVFVSFIAFLAVLSAAVVKPEYVPYVKKHSKIPVIAVLILALVAGVGYVVGSQLFRAKAYSEIISVRTDSDFASEISEPDFGKVPKFDETSAANLASRALGELESMGYVSQFTIFPSYHQINYKNTPVRVATLQYASIIKWYTNRNNGLPGYIIVDAANERADFIALEQSIKYSLADHFGRHVKRVIRFEYPGYIFEEPSFEIDESGYPYWICARIDKTIGLFGGRDIIGIVLVDAITGECVYYTGDDLKNDPELRWIDRVYSSSLIIEQFDFYGKYRKGFWNSLLGQDDCLETTEDNNYIAQDDDVWIYTGVTSVTADQSIIGFLLVNQRTKETVLYRVSGAKESTAQKTAEGLVQQFEYKASFPILLNIAGEPTYFMSLKDANNVVQLYAMVNVRQYNKIKVSGNTLAQCLENYTAGLKKEGISVGSNLVVPPEGSDPNAPGAPKANVIEGVIADIRSAVISGGTVYYIRLEGGAAYYSIAAEKSEAAIILNKGDSVKLTAEESEDDIIALTKLERVDAPAFQSRPMERLTEEAAE